MTYLLVSVISEIDNRKCLINLYENVVQSANILCDVRNIFKFTVYNNLKRFWEVKSKLRCSRSGCKRIFNVNQSRHAAQLTANHPICSAWQIADDSVRRGSFHVSKWTISQTLARSEYFKCVQQSISFITDQHKWKRRTGELHIMIITLTTWYLQMEVVSSLNPCTWKRWAKYGHCQKILTSS